MIKLLKLVYVHKATGRRVTLEKHLGGGRWLCADLEQKCHPCYNAGELELETRD